MHTIWVVWWYGATSLPHGERGLLCVVLPIVPVERGRLSWRGYIQTAFYRFHNIKGRTSSTVTDCFLLFILPMHTPQCAPRLQFCSPRISITYDSLSYDSLSYDSKSSTQLCVYIVCPTHHPCVLYKADILPLIKSIAYVYITY